MSVGFNFIDDEVTSSSQPQVKSGSTSLGFDLIDDEQPSKTLIKVVGVGGAGGNAINHMI